MAVAFSRLGRREEEDGGMDKLAQQCRGGPKGGDKKVRSIQEGNGGEEDFEEVRMAEGGERWGRSEEELISDEERQVGEMKVEDRESLFRIRRMMEA